MNLLVFRIAYWTFVNTFGHTPNPIPLLSAHNYNILFMIVYVNYTLSTIHFLFTSVHLLLDMNLCAHLGTQLIYLHCGIEEG